MCILRGVEKVMKIMNWKQMQITYKGKAPFGGIYYEKNEQDYSTGCCGNYLCTSPMMVMASDSSSVMSQAEEILKDNEIGSLASDPG